MVLNSFPNSKYSFEFYLNTDKLSWQQVKVKTGCKVLINWPYFHLANFLAAKTRQQIINSLESGLVIDGEVLSKVVWHEWGLVIDDKGNLSCGLPEGQKNYTIALPPLVIDGKPYNQNKIDANGCTAVGFTSDGTPWFLLAAKGDKSSMTSDEVITALKAKGCVHILRGDGSWSSQGDLDKGLICDPAEERIVPVYLLAFERAQDKPIPPTAPVAEKEPLFCFDVGHGYNSAGKRCLKEYDKNETREWWMGNRMALYAAEYLKDYKCRIMRSDDITGVTNVDLIPRTEAANKAGADAFVSFHHNASKDKNTGSGICLFTKTKPTEASKKLAQAIYDKTIKYTGLKGNRYQGLWESDFTVLTKTSMSAVLGEFGFMDHSYDVPIIISDDFSRKCAKGIAEALIEVYKLEKRASIEPTVYKVSVISKQIGAYTDKTTADKIASQLKALGCEVVIS